MHAVMGQSRIDKESPTQTTTPELRAHRNPLAYKEPSHAVQEFRIEVEGSDFGFWRLNLQPQIRGALSSFPAS